MAFLKRNILIVDNHLPSRKAVATVLRQAGYTCSTADDSFHATDMIQKYPFDLILTELSLPHESGRDFIKQLKVSAKTRGIPVVVYSERADVQTIQKTMALGAVDYLLKPVDKDALLAKFSRILGGRPRFAEVPMASDDTRYSEVVFPTHVVSIGEAGMVIWSPIPLDEDSEHRIRAKVFAQIGINSPNLKVDSCQKADKGYNVYFTFIGLKDTDMQHVRSWVIDKNLVA